jgi:hypothetical protein
VPKDQPKGPQIRKSIDIKSKQRSSQVVAGIKASETAVQTDIEMSHLDRFQERLEIASQNNKQV